MSSVLKYSEQVRENANIEFNELVFHPLTVRDYDLYICGKAAFELMQSSLPPRFARLNWCAALDAIGKEAGSDVYLRAALNVLAKALQLPIVTNENGETGYLMTPIRDQNGNLAGIWLRAENIILNMQMMDEVRVIIAAQNGYQIPDESWNPDLVADAKYTQSQDAPKLKIDIEDLVCSVAVNSGTDADTIWGWPIRKLMSYAKAIDRKLGYQIYTLAQAVGLTKFENGAPFPTWKFDKISELPSGFKTLGQLEAKAKGQLPEAQEQH